MKTITSMVIGVMSLIITGCGNNDSNDSATGSSATPAVAIEYQGTWQAAGYASTIDINEDSVRIYHYSSDYCLLSDSLEEITTSEIEQLVQLHSSANYFEIVSGFGTEDVSAPGITYNKIDELPTACQQGLQPQIGDSGYHKNPIKDLDIFYQFFNEYYLDFETKGVDFEDLYQQAQQQVFNDTLDNELANVMAEMIAPLADVHIQVVNRDGIDFNRSTNKPLLVTTLVEEFAILNSLPYPIPEALIDQSLVDELNAYVMAMYQLQWQLVADYALSEQSIHTAADDLIRWFERDGIGYLYIGAMTGYAEEYEDLSDTDYAQQSLNELDQALDLALSDLAQTQGLIIDVRTNGGGHDFISLAIASRFVETADTHVYSKQARLGNGRTELIDVSISPIGKVQYLSPIALLTSANTVSGAEVFTLAMKQLPNVTIIGESTQGAFSDVLNFTLPNGFEVGLSNEYYLSPQGNWYEYQGVPVDIEVPFFSPEQRGLEIDAGIETAFDWLTN